MVLIIIQWHPSRMACKRNKTLEQFHNGWWKKKFQMYRRLTIKWQWPENNNSERNNPTRTHKKIVCLLYKACAHHGKKGESIDFLADAEPIRPTIGHGGLKVASQFLHSTASTGHHPQLQYQGLPASPLHQMDVTDNHTKDESKLILCPVYTY